MHKTDILYRLPSLSDESLIKLEREYRMADELRECRGNFNYNRTMWVRASMELYNRKNKRKKETNEN